MPSNCCQSFVQTAADFHRDGFAVIPDFLTPEEVDELKAQVDKIIREKNPKNMSKFVTPRNRDVEYTADSVDKIGFFFEAECVDDNGRLIVDPPTSINKIAHGLHWRDPVFKKTTFSDKIKRLVKAIGMKDPAVCQGMYIFKNPRFGGEFLPHQDATYLNTKPIESGRLLGVWFALADATAENGCLWFVPGSHRDGLQAQLVRSSAVDGKQAQSVNELNERGLKYTDAEFVPGEVKTGGCVLIDGLVVHKSAPNRSDKPRPAYTFHMFERHQTEWDKQNWLQSTKDYDFPGLFDN